MKSKYIIFWMAFFMCGCEVFVIGSKNNKPVIVANQKSPMGAVYLFKADIDSNDMTAASQLLIQPTGATYLAVERYDMKDEMERITRLMAKRAITKIKADSINDKLYRINLELDFRKTYSISTTKINDSWFIISFLE